MDKDFWAEFTPKIGAMTALVASLIVFLSPGVPTLARRWFRAVRRRLTSTRKRAKISAAMLAVGMVFSSYSYYHFEAGRWMAKKAAEKEQSAKGNPVALRIKLLVTDLQEYETKFPQNPTGAESFELYDKFFRKFDGRLEEVGRDLFKIGADTTKFLSLARYQDSDTSPNTFSKKSIESILAELNRLLEML